jgi:hypothetical protein
MISILPQKEMIMIWHEAVSYYSDLVSLGIFFNQPEAMIKISRIEENSPTPNTSVVEMKI